MIVYLLQIWEMQECKTITICSNVRATVIICHLGNIHVLSLKSPVNCIYHYLCISIHSEQNQSKKQQHGLDVQYYVIIKTKINTRISQFEIFWSDGTEICMFVFPNTNSKWVWFCLVQYIMHFVKSIYVEDMVNVIVKKGQYNTSLNFLLSKKVKKQST